MLTVGETETGHRVGNRLAGPVGHDQVETRQRVEVVAVCFPSRLIIGVASPKKLRTFRITSRLLSTVPLAVRATSSAHARSLDGCSIAHHTNTATKQVP